VIVGNRSLKTACELAGPDRIGKREEAMGAQVEDSLSLCITILIRGSNHLFYYAESLWLSLNIM